MAAIQPSQCQVAGLCSLPEEILSDIFNYMPTKELLCMSSTSRRVRECANALFSQRMRNASGIEDFNLIFECSTPSGKNTTPYHRCSMKGHTSDISAGKNLSDVYSRFHPLPHSGHGYNEPMRQTNNSIFDDSSDDDDGERTNLFQQQQQQQQQQKATPKQPASTTVVLEGGEFFTQLCTSAIFVRLGPRSGLFNGVVKVFEDSIFRIRRSELKAVSHNLKNPSKLVWVDDEHNVGLKIRVTEHDRRAFVPLPWQSEDEDEDCFTTYTVEYEELLIRTGHIVSIIEEERDSHSGINMYARNSVVIGLV